MNIKTVLIAIILSGLCYSLQAQPRRSEGRSEDKRKQKKGNEKDSIPTRIISWYNQETVTGRSYELPDTFSEGFQSLIPVTRASFVSSYLGNVGLPAKSALYHPEDGRMNSSYIFPSIFEDPDDCDFLFSRYSSFYYLSPRNIKFYNTTKPFTDIIYTAASRKRDEQQFKVVHSQNIGPFFNFTLIYNGITSAGENDYQESKLKSFGTSMNYDGKKYKAWLIFANNKLENQESGGFGVDSSKARQDFFPPRLKNAESKSFNRHISFGQSLFFFKKFNKDTTSLSDSIALIASDSLRRPTPRPRPRLKPSLEDTLKTVRKDSLSKDSSLVVNDSIGLKTDTLIAARKMYWQRMKSLFKRKDSMIDPRKYVYLVSFSHKISYDKNSFNYLEKSANRDFYQHVRFDSTATYDSVYHHTLKNNFELKLHENWSPKYGFAGYAGLEHEANKLYNFRHFLYQINDTSFNSTAFYGGLDGKLTEHFKWHVAFKHYLAGYKLNTYSFKAGVSTHVKIWKDTLSLAFNIGQRTIKPDIFEQRYFSNHFSWENDFSDKKTRNALFSIDYPATRTSLKLRYSEIENPIYFNNDAVPVQYNGKVIVQSAVLKQDVHFWWFWWRNQVAYQQSDNIDVLPLPEIGAYSSLYFEKRFFGVLNIQLGFDAFFNTKWHSFKYMPATAQFCVQNEVKTGEIPVVDVFLNMKLKNRALIFLKLENVTDLATDDKYFPTVDYPINSMAFKFGVSWWFHD